MRALVATGLAALALVAAGCGGKDTSATTTATVATAPPVATTPTVAPAVTAFRAHVDAATAALRDGIEQPLRDGAFSGSVTQRVAALANAGTAVSTAVRELTAAVNVARGPGGVPRLAEQVESLVTEIPDLISGARSGNLDTDRLATFLDKLDALGDAAAAGGLDVPSTAGTTSTTP